MAVQLGNNRLTLGMAISLLAHLLVFFSLGLLLQMHTTIPQEKLVEKLEVRLTQTLTPKAQPKPGKKLLTTSSPAPFKIAQANIKDAPDSVPQPSAKIAEQSPQPAEEVAGVAFPAAAATPWPGQNRASNSLFSARSSQQDAARTYYQQTMEAQARQRSEQQAQLMILQLQQLLAKRLDVHPIETGKCMLAESDEGANHKMVCDSPALYEVLSPDEKFVVETLMALRGMGRMLKGFSAEIRAEKLVIILIYEE